MSTVPEQQPLRFAYNTNGFTFHRLDDVITILSGLGYDGIALTLDWQHLDPLTASRADIEKIRARLVEANLAVSIETGAKYLLDPVQKQEPTLVSPERRAKRLEYLCRAIDVAQALRAESVGFFSGHVDSGVEPARAMDAESAGVHLAIEPEPGMLTGTLEAGVRLIEAVGSPALGMTVDIGHVRCSDPIPEAEAIATYAQWTRAVHIEDIAGRAHAHLLFGEGDIVFEPILTALVQSGYSGLVSVELSRDSERAPDAAKMSLEFLRRTAAGVCASMGT